MTRTHLHGASVAPVLAALAGCAAAPPGPPPGVTATNEQIVARLLEVIEVDVVPLTERGVRQGDKVFGAAILRKDDLSLVLAASNHETANPLYHGEVHAINLFWQLPRDERPAPEDCIFLATHEPCPLCLSAITWGGYDNFYCLFSYEESRDSFKIGHDLKILKEVFRRDPGGYAAENDYWTMYRITDLIETFEEPTRDALLARIEKLIDRYAELSAIYQRSKGASDIPLK
jgi:tRNA(Arg) A34 adenosine deaminase TadA